MNVHSVAVLKDFQETEGLENLYIVELRFPAGETKTARLCFIFFEGSPDPSPNMVLTDFKFNGEPSDEDTVFEYLESKKKGVRLVLWGDLIIRCDYAEPLTITAHEATLVEYVLRVRDIDIITRTA